MEDADTTLLLSRVEMFECNVEGYLLESTQEYYKF